MKILVIEDEIKIANLLKNNFEAVGHTAELAITGTDGFRAAMTKTFDIIILDIMLPGMNGFQVAKSLRKKKITTPIVILTARDSADDRKNSFAAGANAYLVKPIEFNTLLTRLTDLVNPRLDNSPRIFSRVEDLMNNIKTRNNNAKVPSKTISEPLSNPLAHTLTAQEKSVEIAALNKSIMDLAPISIITIDKEGYITSANKYFKKISKTQKFRNHNVFTSEFFIRENLVDDYRNLLTNGTMVRRDKCHEKNSKGEDKYLKLIASPLFDAEGNIDGALSMAIDNTEEVVSKNNLISLNNRLELTVQQRTSQLNKAVEELNKVLKIKSAFAADVSHEMRTSLTIIQGNLELMTRTGAITDLGTESVEQIYQEISRMSSMLTNLTSITNADSAAQKLNYTKVNLNELIEAACNSLKVLANEKGISIEYKKTPSEIEIMIDKSKVDELLLNLIRNAIKYNKPNGWIKIQARKIGKNFTIKVEDGGIGIPKKHLPFIFERFYRIDSARTRDSGGSGLGLAICKWIAEIHGGKLSVTSKIGSGSTFSVTMPLVNSDLACSPLQSPIDKNG